MIEQIHLFSLLLAPFGAEHSVQMITEIRSNKILFPEKI